MIMIPSLYSAFVMVLRDEIRLRLSMLVQKNQRLISYKGNLSTRGIIIQDVHRDCCNANSLGVVEIVGMCIKTLQFHIPHNKGRMASTIFP